MKWISVEERLPDTKHHISPKVLILAEGRIYTGRTDGNLWAKDVSTGELNIMLNEKVTHWAPLPEPPEETT